MAAGCSRYRFVDLGKNVLVNVGNPISSWRVRDRTDTSQTRTLGESNECGCLFAMQLRSNSD